MTGKFSRFDTTVMYGALPDQTWPKEWPQREYPISFPIYSEPMEPLVIPSVPCEPAKPPTTTEEIVNNIVEIAKKRISTLQDQKQLHQNEINILEEEIDTLQKIIDATE